MKLVYLQIFVGSFMDKDVLWDTVLGEMEVLVSKATFGTFLASSKLLNLDGEVATIAGNTPVAANMMENRYYSLIKKLLDKHSKQNTSLLFKVVAAVKKNDSFGIGPLFQQPAVDETESIIKAARIRPDFTFDSFAVSTSNQMAYAASTAVAQSPGSSYNPLFLYGGVGVGKTHLMLAIGNEVLRKKISKKVIYCMGEEFTNEIVQAIQTKSTHKFKEKYRSAKVLLIDDVQFLQGKLKVQEEFFHTFNAIQREGGQIVLTSDRPPQEIDRLEERLSSRFEAGLLVDVQNPDFELKCAIVRIKAQQKGTEVSFEVARLLAANSDSVRQMEGFLNKLLTEASLKKIPISQELAQSVVGKPNLSQDTPKKLFHPKQIIDLVLSRYSLTLGQIKSSNRSRPLARPRQVLMYLLRTELKLSLDDVGVWVGGRDHSTVIHAVGNISNLLSTNVFLREDVEWIKKQMYG